MVKPQAAAEYAEAAREPVQLPVTRAVRTHLDPGPGHACGSTCLWHPLGSPS